MSSATGVRIRYRDAIAVAGRGNPKVQKSAMRRRPPAGLTDMELVALLEQQSPAGTCSSPKAVSCLLDRPATDTTRGP
jgi:hypothetical protein